MFTYGQIVKIFTALAEIRKLRIPYAKARAICTLYKNIETEYMFFAQEELKLAREYATKGANGEPMITETGNITFPNVEAKRAYADEINKLSGCEVNINIDALGVVLNAEDIGTQTVKPETIEMLDGIITFI